MSDLADIDALISGDADLVHRDYRNYNVERIDVRRRDFSKSHFMGAVFTGCDFTGSNFNAAQMNSASFIDCNFSEITMHHTVMVAGRLTKTKLTGASLSNSHFAQVNFDLCDFRGADFSRAHINEGCSFQEAISDEATNFDGVNRFRPLAAHSLFRFYEVRKGVLARIETKSILRSNTESALSDRVDVQNVRDTVKRAIKALEEVAFAPVLNSSSEGIGHNGPPEEFALTREETVNTVSELREIENELTSASPNSDKVLEHSRNISKASDRIKKWAVKILEAFTTSFATSAGEQAAKMIAWSYLAVTAANLLSNVVQIAQKFGHP